MFFQGIYPSKIPRNQSTEEGFFKKFILCNYGEYLVGSGSWKSENQLAGHVSRPAKKLRWIARCANNLNVHGQTDG